MAEVLIALAIVGVVAALTIPPLITNVTQNTFNTASAVFTRKLEEAANQMSVAGDLTGYTTNEQFADAFTKYIKVAKRCTSANLNECFVSQFTTSGGQDIVVSSDLKTSSHLGTFNNSNPLIGFLLLNGTSVIMAYNPNCTPSEADKYNTSQSHTTCMSMLYDTNASAGPNKMGKDITALNANITACDVRVSGLCIAAGDTTSVSINTCSDSTWDSNLSANSYCADNRWAGAKKSCSDQGMRLPSKAELNTIYTNRATISGLNLAAYYWSATEGNADTAWYQYFPNGIQYNHYKSCALNVRCVR